MIRSNHGFFTVQSLLFIGLFMTLTFCFGFLDFIGQAKMKFRTTCLKESIELQKQIIAIEKKLFYLNPLSTSLQLEYDITIAAAESSTILPPAAAALHAKALLIQAQQFQLDQVQRGLIKTAGIIIASQTSKIEMQMSADSWHLTQSWNHFLISFFQIRPSHMARLSVHASNSGIAPNYELNQNYKQEQKVAFLWHLKYLTKPKSQTLIKSENSFEMSCEARPLEKENSWSIEI